MLTGEKSKGFKEIFLKVEKLKFRYTSIRSQYATKAVLKVESFLTSQSSLPKRREKRKARFRV